MLVLAESDLACPFSKDGTKLLFLSRIVSIAKYSYPFLKIIISETRIWIFLLEMGNWNFLGGKASRIPVFCQESVKFHTRHILNPWEIASKVINFIFRDNLHLSLSLVHLVLSVFSSIKFPPGIFILSKDVR